MDNTKSYDWFAASLFQPDMTPSDLLSLGVTSGNSTLQSRDVYKENKDVQKAFSSSGKFDENAFNNFYDACLTSYNEVSDDAYNDLVLDYFASNPNDWMSPASKIVDTSTHFEFGTNVLGQSSSISAFGKIDTPALSAREIGQRNNVVDSRTGEELDYTPNDLGFFGSITSPTLVLAQYDNDEVDEDGVFHKAGELKRKKDGSTYYETLGDKAIGNKQVLRPLDVLTIDGSNWNKLDIFDSDDLYANGTKAAMRTALKVAPMFIPGFGSAYATTSALLNVAKVLPEVGKMVHAFIDPNNEATTQQLNELEAFAAKFGRSTTDESQERTFTWENAFNFVGSTAVQLFQQQAIAKNSLALINKMGSKNADLAKAMSTGYLALTSTEGVYNDFIDAGADEKTAAIGALANMAALAAFLNTDYYKQYIFKGIKGLDPTMRDLHNPTKNLIEMYMKKTGGASALTQGNAKKVLQKFTRLFGEGLLPDTNEYVNYTMGGFFRASLSEGVEEVMEEGATDFVKSLVKGLDLLGVKAVREDKDVAVDFGFTPENAAYRYGMAFAGGFGGGAIFHGVNAMQLGRHKLGKNLKTLDDSTLREISYLVGQGRADEIRKYVTKLHDKGMLGNKDLSGTNFEEIADLNDNKVNVADANNKSNDSQNDIVYQAVMQHINYIENMMLEENLIIGEKAFDTYGESKNLVKTLVDLSHNSWFGEEGRDSDERRMKQASLMSYFAVDGGMLKEFEDLTSDLLRAKDAYNETVIKAEAELTGDQKDDKEKRAKALKENKSVVAALEKYKVSKQAMDDFRSGKNAKKYVGRGAFMLDRSTSEHFAAITDIDTYTSIMHHCSYDSLTDIQKKNVDYEYKKYMEKEGKANLWRAYDIYAKFSENSKPLLDAFNTEAINGKLDERRSQTTLWNDYTKVLDLVNNAKKILENPDSTEEEKQNAQEYIDQYEKVIASQFSEYQALLGIKDAEGNTIASPDYQAIGDVVIKTDEEHIQQSAYLIAHSNEKEARRASLTALADIIKQTYKKAINDGIILQDDQELEEFLRNGLSMGDAEEIKQMFAINSPLINAGISSKNLTNIKNEYQAAISCFKVGNVTEGQKRWENAEDMLNSLTVGGNMFTMTEEEEANALENFGAPQIDAAHTEVPGIFYNYAYDLDEDDDSYDETGYDILRSDAARKTDKTLPERTKQYIRDIMVPSFGDQPILDFIKEIQDLKSKCKYTPTKELFKQFLKRFGNTDLSLLDTIEAQIRGLASYSDIKEYILASPEAAAQLKSIDQVINIIEGLLSGATSGLNEAINIMGGNLVVMDANVREMIHKDLNLWKMRVHDLLDIADASSKNKLKEQKEIAIHCLPLFKARLTDSVFAEEFQKITGINPKTIWDQSFAHTYDFDNINESNYNKFEEGWIKFETALCEARSKLTAEKQLELPKLLVKLFNDDTMFVGESTELSVDTTQISNYDFATYLMDVLYTPSIILHGAIKNKLEKNTGFAPVFSQEMIVRHNIAWIANQRYFNIFFNACSETVNDYIKNNNLSGEEARYYKNRPNLEAVNMFLGGAGVGKTTAITGTMVEMLEALGVDVEYVCVAATKEQADNLKNNVHTNSKVTSIAKDEVLRTFYGDEYPSTTQDKIINGNQHFNGYINVSGIALPINASKLSAGTTWDAKNSVIPFAKDTANKNKSVFTGTHPIRIMLVDEASLISSGEWQLLSNRAKNDFVILGMGDMHQQAAQIKCYWSVNSDGKIVYNETPKMVASSIEDCNVQRTPYVKVTMRSDNQAMYEIAMAYNKLFKDAEEYMAEKDTANPELSKTYPKIFNFASSKTENFLNPSGARKPTNKITHYYYHDDDGSKFCGIKVTNSTDARKILSKIEQVTDKSGKTYPNIGYIYDEGKEGQFPSDKKYDARSATAAQGGEFDYVVVNLSWLNNNKPNNKLFTEANGYANMIRTLYTTIQRAKKGCIIINDNASQDIEGHLGIVSKFDPTKTRPFAISQEQLVSFKKWRLSSYENITYNQDAFKSLFDNALKSSKITSPVSNSSASSNNSKNGGAKKDDGKITRKQPDSGTAADSGLFKNKKKEGIVFKPTNFSQRKEIRSDDAKNITYLKGTAAGENSPEKSNNNFRAFADFVADDNITYITYRNNINKALFGEGDTRYADNFIKFIASRVKNGLSDWFEDMVDKGSTNMDSKYGYIIPKMYDVNGDLIEYRKLDFGKAKDIEVHSMGLSEEQIEHIMQLKIFVNSNLNEDELKIFLTQIPDIYIRRYNDDQSLMTAVFRDIESNKSIEIPIDIIDNVPKSKNDKTPIYGLYKGVIRRDSAITADKKVDGRTGIDNLCKNNYTYCCGVRVLNTDGIEKERYKKFLGIKEGEDQTEEKNGRMYALFTDRFDIFAISQRDDIFDDTDIDADISTWKPDAEKREKLGYLYKNARNTVLLGTAFRARPSQVVLYAKACESLIDLIARATVDRPLDNSEAKRLRGIAEQLGKDVYGDSFKLPDLPSDIENLKNGFLKEIYKRKYDILNGAPHDNSEAYLPTSQAERFVGKIFALSMAAYKDSTTITPKDNWHVITDVFLNSIFGPYNHELLISGKIIDQAATYLEILIGDESYIITKENFNYVLYSKSAFDKGEKTSLSTIATDQFSHSIYRLLINYFEKQGRSTDYIIQNIEGIRPHFFTASQVGIKDAVIVNGNKLVDMAAGWLTNETIVNELIPNPNLTPEQKQQRLFDIFDEDILADPLYKVGVYTNNPARDTAAAGLMEPLYGNPIPDNNGRLSNNYIVDRPKLNNTTWKYEFDEYNTANKHRWIIDDNDPDNVSNDRQIDPELAKFHTDLQKNVVKPINDAIDNIFSKNKSFIKKYDESGLAKYRTEFSTILGQLDSENNADDFEKVIKDYLIKLNNEILKHASNDKFLFPQFNLNDTKITFDSKNKIIKVTPKVDWVLDHQQYLTNWLKEQDKTIDATPDTVGVNSNSGTDSIIKCQIFSLSLGNETHYYLTRSVKNNNGNETIGYEPREVNEDFVEAFKTLNNWLLKDENNPIKQNMYGYCMRALKPNASTVNTELQAFANMNSTMDYDTAFETVLGFLRWLNQNSQNNQNNLC